MNITNLTKRQWGEALLPPYKKQKTKSENTTHELFKESQHNSGLDQLHFSCLEKEADAQLQLTNKAGQSPKLIVEEILKEKWQEIVEITKNWTELAQEKEINAWIQLYDQIMSDENDPLRVFLSETDSEIEKECQIEQLIEDKLIKHPTKTIKDCFSLSSMIF